MRLQFVIAGLFFMTGILSAQNEKSRTDQNLIRCGNGDSISLISLGYVRIVLKDGSQKIKCVIKEIKPGYIIYLKDKVMHDIMIDKIRMIVTQDESKVIYFDERNKPTISTYNR